MSESATGRKVIDVSGLPTHAFGAREPAFYGVIGTICVEGSVFTLLLVAYLYIRGNMETWPPSADGLVSNALPAATVGTLALLASAVAVWFMNGAAKRSDLYGMRRWLVAASVFSLVFLAARVVEFRSWPFQWDDHAFGSAVWVLVGVHTFHGLTGFAENAAFLALLFVGPVEKKAPADLHLNGVYWYFIVASWLPIFALLYFDPGKG